MDKIINSNNYKIKEIIFITLTYLLIAFLSAYLSTVMLAILALVTFLYLILFRTRTSFIVIFFLLFVQQSLISANTIYGVASTRSMFISRADDLIWAFLLGIVLIKMKENKNQFKIDKLDISIFMLVIFSILSIIINGRSLLWGGVSIILMIKGYIVYFISNKLIFQRYHIRNFIILYFIALLIIAIIGLLQFIGLNPPMFPPQTRFGVKMINSIFNQHTQFGTIMAFGIAISLSFLLIKKNNWFYIFILIFTVSIILSTLRRSLLAIFIVLLILPFLDKSVSKKIYIPIFMILAVFILMFRNQMMLLINFTFSEYIIGFLSTSRGQLYLGAIKILKHKFLFGEGPGSFAGLVAEIRLSPVYLKYNIPLKVIKYSSDTYIAHILGELGIIGFLLYTNVIVNIYKKIVFLERYFKKNKDKLLLGIILFLKIVLIIGIIESFVSSFFEVIIKTIVLYGILGMLSSYYKMKIKYNSTNKEIIT